MQQAVSNGKGSMKRTQQIVIPPEMVALEFYLAMSMIVSEKTWLDGKGFGVNQKKSKLDLPARKNSVGE